MIFCGLSIYLEIYGSFTLSRDPGWRNRRRCRGLPFFAGAHNHRTPRTETVIHNGESEKGSLHRALREPSEQHRVSASDCISVLFRALERRTLPVGVTSGQWRFLRVLWAEDGLTQIELSRRVGMREPTTVAAVNGLERAGYVVRRKSSTDRRKVHVHLTARAKRLKTKLIPFVAEVNALGLKGSNCAAVGDLAQGPAQDHRQFQPRRR